MYMLPFSFFVATLTTYCINVPSDSMILKHNEE